MSNFGSGLSKENSCEIILKSDKPVKEKKSSIYVI